jgi:hypothetical protein
MENAYLRVHRQNVISCIYIYIIFEARNSAQCGGACVEKNIKGY